MSSSSIIIKDSKGREIHLEENLLSVIAKFNGKKIGEFSFDSFASESKPVLINCDIIQDFQRSGIGTEMIKFGEFLYDDFLISDHLSGEGAAFLNYCKSIGIFKHNHETIKNDNF